MAGTFKPTRAQLDDMKSALQTLTELQSEMGSGGTGGAYARLADAADISADLGPLLNGQGPEIAAYYSRHALAVRGALQLSGAGIDAAVTMLRASIQAYEQTEQRNASAADATATG